MDDSGYDLLHLHYYLSGSEGSDDECAVHSDQVLPSDYQNWLQCVSLLPHAVVQNPKLLLPALRDLLLLWRNGHGLFLHSGAEGVHTHAQQKPSLHFFCLVPHRVLHVCSKSGEETVSPTVLHVHLHSCDPAECSDSLQLNHSKPL